MRHPAGLRLAAILLVGLPAAALATPAQPKGGRTGKGELAQGRKTETRTPGDRTAKQPDRADLAQRRFALIDALDGWRALAEAQGALGALAGKLGDLKQALLKIELGADLRAAGKALDDGGRSLDQLKAELLAALYAARSDGRSLQDAAPEERSRFESLAASQAEAFKQLARQPVAPGPELSALQARMLSADSARNIERLFENSAARGVKAEAVAETIDPVPSHAPAAEAVVPASSGSSPWRVAAEPLAQSRINWPAPAASHAVLRAPADDAPIQLPAKGDHSTGAKQTWQRELLRRTGVTALLAAVGVDSERFVRALTGAESDYATNATSWAGAAGIMQVMPGTARGIMSGSRYRELAREYGLTVYSPKRMSDSQIQRMLNSDWRTCALLGILYIEDQARTFVGYAKNLAISVNDKAKLAMNMIAGAYNAGPGRIWQAFSRLRRQGLWLDDVNPGQSLVRFTETKNYVRKILSHYGFGG